MRIAHLIAFATTGLLAACVGQIDNMESCPPDTETFAAQVWAPGAVDPLRDLPQLERARRQL